MYTIDPNPTKVLNWKKITKKWLKRVAASTAINFFDLNELIIIQQHATKRQRESIDELVILKFEQNSRLKDTTPPSYTQDVLAATIAWLKTISESREVSEAIRLDASQCLKSNVNLVIRQLAEADEHLES
jgi:hypothetical protein